MPWVSPLMAGVLVALAAGTKSLAPAGVLPRPAEMLGWAALALLAASYRPWGATLGAGTLVLPAAIVRLGAVPAALVVIAVYVLAEVWRNMAWRKVVWWNTPQRRDAGRDAGRRGWLQTALLRAPLLGVAVLVAGLAGDPAFAALAYLCVLFLLLLVTELTSLRTPGLRTSGRGTSGRGNPGLHEILPLAAALALDLLGWLLGMALADVARTVGWQRCAPFAAAVGLALLEASRLAARREASEMRTSDLERLQHAHRRILAEISGMGGIAQQFLTECVNVLPVQWFQFELPQPDGTSHSWSAGPDGVLVEGEPKPAEHPPVIPGVHRRASWHVVEHRLKTPPEGGSAGRPDAAADDTGEVLAILRLWCDPRRLEKDAEQLLVTLVPQMAASLHRAQLDREAKLDPLTGVPVRRMLESRLQRAYRLCCEEGWSMSVLMCDIDYFKKVNDTYGHAAGDAALVAFAQVLDGHRRDNDLCCRYGGEEFTLLLESTPGDAALRLAERLRLAVEDLEVEHEGQRIPLTMSVGIAAFPELHVKTASELLLLADEALYEAKEQGRNRCLLHLGKGAFRAPTGRPFRSRNAPPESAPPRFFG
jgi:diguanylate cyclase (GGDEF)-like protein